MKPKTSPKDFFLYLGVIVTLYVVVIAVLRLWFATIDASFPDPLEYNYYYGFADGSLRAAIAALVVIFPIHLFLARLWNTEMRQSPDKQDLWVRKWLIYLTLFVAGVTLAVDLIILVERFLSGDLTTRFALKLLAVFAAAAASFGYFMYDLKRDVVLFDPRLKLFASGASTLLLLSIIGGFLIIGSPRSARLVRLDNERIAQLQSIEWQIAEHWQRYKALPVSLEELNESIGYVPATDPENEPYVYRAVSPTSFELCATFSTGNSVRSGDKQQFGRAPYFNPGATPTRIDESFFIKGGSWEHGTGNVCFTREIQLEQPLSEAPIKLKQ